MVRISIYIKLLHTQVAFTYPCQP